MTLSVVIPAFNEEAILGRTLEAVHAAAAAAGASCEVIVADNASTDGTAKIAARSGARVITEPVHNIARVRNTGAAAALGDVLIFLDADTLVPRDLLAAIANVLRDESIFTWVRTSSSTGAWLATRSAPARVSTSSRNRAS